VNNVNFENRQPKPLPKKEEPKKTRQQRDPEDRPTDGTAYEIREKTMDKTLADSFPTSDPPSTIPDPEEDDDSSEA
jgi:hypothetical protein